jgi:hypothetical protein
MHAVHLSKEVRLSSKKQGLYCIFSWCLWGVGAVCALHVLCRSLWVLRAAAVLSKVSVRAASSRRMLCVGMVGGGGRFGVVSA